MRSVEFLNKSEIHSLLMDFKSEFENINKSLTSINLNLKI